MARLSSELVLSLKDRVTRPARGVETSMDRLRNRASRSAMGIERSAASMGRMGLMMGGLGAGALGVTGGVAAVGYSLKSTTTEAADFESALTGIQKKAGTTAEETRALGEEIKELATSGELATSIDEIAAAYERGAAAGIPVDKLREFAALSAKAADAFEMDSETVGNAAAGFATNLDIPISEMQRYFDLINGLADAGIADESEIVSFLDRAGTQLTMFGQSREQAAALGATLLNLKMPAEVASRAMNTLSTKLLTPKATARSKEAFDALYGSADVFTEMLQEDANGALIDFLDRIGELDKFQRAELLTGILGQGFSDEVSRLSSGLDEFRRNLDYAADDTQWFNSLDKSYQLKLDDFWSQWDLLKNEVTSLAINLGDGGLPALKDGLADARGIVAEIGDGLDSFKANVDLESLSDAQEAVGELAGVIGELMNMGGEGTAISRFFDSMADDINTISRTINTVKDLGQRAGIVPPDDDSPEQLDNRWRRTMRDWFGGAGEDVYDATTGVEPSRMARDLEDRREVHDYLRQVEGTNLPRIPNYLNLPGNEAERERWVRFMNMPPPGAARPYREPANPGRPTGHSSQSEEQGVPLPRARPSNAPAPRPRPQEIGSVMEREGERATRAAQQAGRDIETALSLETRPRIDMREIDDALRKVAQLSSRLRAIPGETRQAQTAVAAMDARSARTTSAELRNQFSDAVVG